MCILEQRNKCGYSTVECLNFVAGWAWSVFRRVIKKDGLDVVEQWQGHFCQPT